MRLLEAESGQIVVDGIVSTLDTVITFCYYHLA